MKKLQAILVLMFVGFGAFAQYEPEAKAVLDAVSSKYKNMTAFKADFQYRLVNEEADINEEMDGSIHIMDDKFKLEMLNRIIFFDGNFIREYDVDFQEYTVRDYESEHEELNLSSMLDLYKDGFKYMVRSQSSNGYEIELQPEANDKSFFKILMKVDAKNNVKSFTYYEKNGNLVTTEITNQEEKPGLKASFFDFFKANLEVVDSVDVRD
ncbi:MAG: outer membrane lipoprotein carrier protein LolA [bacterium]|nr:outer membrane lipoprotein carrier protein LolA [bacterium]